MAAAATAAIASTAAPGVARLHLLCSRFVALLVSCISFYSSSAVAASLQSPLVTSNAGVAVAACGAVANLADGNPENTTKLGAAGACEGGYPA